MILSRNSSSLVYHTATALSKIYAWLLTPRPESYITSQQYLLQSTQPICFLLLPEPTPTANAVIAKASNPSKSAVPSSHLSSYLCWIRTFSDRNGNQRPRSWGMFPNFHSPSAGRYPVFLLLMNLLYLISRKWGTRSWFHQLLSLMLIFSGIWVILIHLILSAKKPTRSPLNSRQ